MNNTDVAKYYETNQFYYSKFWSPTALHYGLWYSNTTSLAEAITNTNALVARAVNINVHDRVLDAGCGVGGTSIYLSESTGAEVHGVTLSPRQLGIANSLAAKSPAKDRLNFSIMDYCHTIFGDGMFSKIVAIESVCHTTNKLDFLLEAARLLRPGGQIAVIDFFFARENLTREERNAHEKSMNGWAVSNLATSKEFVGFMERAGFINIQPTDLVEHIWPSVERIYRWGLLAWPINFVKVNLARAPRSVACRYQRYLFRQRIGTYRMFVATKPGGEGDQVA